MAAPNPAGRWVAKARLGSGLVVMSFVLTHLINHAFGLVSADMAEAARQTPLGIWHRGPLYLLILTALTTHVATALLGLLNRRTLRMPLWQAAQIALGLAIPFWLVIHILGTRGLELRHGTMVNYYFELWLLWPGLAQQQMLLSLLVWLHGCMGLHFWLRQRLTYRRVQGWLLAFAVLLPTLSMLGFVSGGRDMHARIAADPTLLPSLKEQYRWVPLGDTVWVYDVERWVLGTLITALAVIVVWRVVRHVLLLRQKSVRLTYESGRSIRVPIGTSILEASRMAGIPHASVCGGRGRCSTCRVRVSSRGKPLPPADAAEQRVLDRLGAMGEVRLACQLRPTHDLEVALLMPAEAAARDSLRRMDPGLGTEREIAVLFADLRSFTQFAEGRLPFDVVFVLNRYFKTMGEAIEEEGGRLDKFIGDGIMALFGIDTDSRTGARQALAAARAMGKGLEALNMELQGDMPKPLRMGIGLHMGPAIIGEMGYGRTVSLTAIGDTVNVASRLEAASKELRVELVVSADLLAKAGVAVEDGMEQELLVRGRVAPLGVVGIAQAASLPIGGEPKAVVGGGMIAAMLARMTRARSRMASGRG